jgi:hypothetical protein
MLKDNSRVFFVTDSLEAEAELFETYREAMNYADLLKKDNHEQIRVCIRLINNAYKEHDGGRIFWNYEDLSDTFGEIFIQYAI